jgi:hypothetical protein
MFLALSQMLLENSQSSITKILAVEKRKMSKLVGFTALGQMLLEK